MLFLKGSLSEMVKYLWVKQCDACKGRLFTSYFLLLLCLKCQDQQTPVSDSVAWLSGLGSPGSMQSHAPGPASVSTATPEATGALYLEVAPEVTTQRA